MAIMQLYMHTTCINVLPGRIGVVCFFIVKVKVIVHATLRLKNVAAIPKYMRSLQTQQWQGHSGTQSRTCPPELPVQDLEIEEHRDQRYDTCNGVEDYPGCDKVADGVLLGMHGLRWPGMDWHVTKNNLTLFSGFGLRMFFMRNMVSLTAEYASMRCAHKCNAARR